MSRDRKKPAMLAGIVLVTLIFTSQLLSMNFFDDIKSSKNIRDVYNPGAISSSAANEIVQLSGTNQVVRYVALNASAVTVGNTTAASNLTLPATSAPATVLDATNMSLRLGVTANSVNHTIENNEGWNFPYASTANATHSWLNTSVARMAGALQNGTTDPTSTYRNLNTGGVIAWIINSVNITSKPTVRVNLDYPFIPNLVYPNSIRLDTWLNMKLNQPVSLNVYIYDNHNGQGWVKANNNTIGYAGNTLDPQFNATLKFKDLRSQSLRSVNPCVNVSFEFIGSVPFRVTLYTAKAKLYKAREFSVNANNWAALSFDLRGPALVYGFSIYVRSFAIVSSEELTIGVFRTNTPSITMNQIADTSPTLSQRPDLGQFIAGTNRNFNHTQDGPNWFNFTTPVYMDIGNYFVILNSSIAGNRYSIVGLPWDDTTSATRDPEHRVDHTFAISKSNGASWYFANISVSSLLKKVDAAPFIVGLKRGLVPSDISMKINGTTVQNYTMSRTLPFSSSNFEWGRGLWSPVKLNARTTTTTFVIPITWNGTKQTSFTYTASASMRIHSEDAGTSMLKLSRDDPLWSVGYLFNRTKYSGWTGLYFNYTFPSDWNVKNITYPDNVDYYESENVTSISSSRKMYSINQSSIIGLAPSLQQKTYVAWFTSPNYTKSVSTYLRYNATTFYETPHFVNGDNISARVQVQTGSGKAVLNGQVNFTLFNPSNIQVVTNSSSTINSTIGFITRYHFSDASLYTFMGVAVGRHLARVFWFNGSEAGIYYYDTFKVNYTVAGYGVTELLSAGVNQVSGSFLTGANESIPTDMVHVSIDKDNVVPVGLNLNLSLGDLNFLEFNQTQTVYNPDETIGFNVKIKSTSLGLVHQVWVNVQVVQAFHPDRVIMDMSTAPFPLNYTGGTNSEHLFNISGVFPSLGGSGVNAPLRNSLFATFVHIYEDGNIVASWLSDETYAVKMDNATDGTVLAVKIINDYTGTSFSQLFTRTNETVFNNETMFMMLLESSGGVTLSYVLARDFTNSMTSSIREITVVPVAGDVLTKNNNMTLTGRLYFENGSLINDTTVQISRYTDSGWVNYYVTGSTTNNTLPVSNGTFSGIFGIPSIFNRTMTVRFTFNGILSVVTSTSASLTINLTEYTPDWDLRVEASQIVVIGGYYRNYYTFILNNTGNTTLMFADYVRIKDSPITGENVTWLNAGLLNIAPGMEFSFAIVFTANNPGLTQGYSATFMIELHAFSVETKENMNITKEFTASVQPPDLGSQLASVWYLAYFGVIALLVIAAFFLLKRVSAQAKKPVEVGALAKGKAVARGSELPYAVKKGADIAKVDGEKKYKSIDEAMAEVKGGEDKGAASKVVDSDEEEADSPDAGEADASDDANKDEK